MSADATPWRATVVTYRRFPTGSSRRSSVVNQSGSATRLLSQNTVMSWRAFCHGRRAAPTAGRHAGHPEQHAEIASPFDSARSSAPGSSHQSEIEQSLVQAGQGLGLGEGEAVRTVKSGLTAGIDSPCGPADHRDADIDFPDPALE